MVASFSRLRSVSETMKSESPVFIVGAPRSGTSLLYRILQRHSSFRPRQLNLEETDIFQHLWRLPFVRGNDPASLFHYMLEDEESYRAFVDSIKPLRALSTVLLFPNLILRNRATWWWRTMNQGDVVLRAYFYFAKQARGCDRLVEKTPENWRFMDRLAGAFPRCRMLYLCRHPVEQFASYRRRTRDDPRARWAALTVDRFCADYDASTRTVLRALEADNRSLLLLRYEQLTSRPEDTFSRICDFLAVPVEFEALHETNPDRISWEADPYLFHDITAQTKNWRDFITPSEAAQIEARLAPVMKALGYTPLPVSDIQRVNLSVHNGMKDSPDGGS